MTKTGSPKQLWDYCIEFEAYVRSKITNGNADLKGQTPETFMSGETAEISKFYKFGWYDWVMYRNTTVVYPGSKPQLGSCYGTAYDINPSICANILKGNG